MSGTILLADDSLTIQKVVELTFADTDYRVIAVSSGDELLERMRDSQPDLIICDVIMPGRDGYDVCQEIKSSSDWLHLPVILLTGTFEPFDRDRAIAAGCSEIITKPFEARKLVDTVERLIGGNEVQAPATGATADAETGDSWAKKTAPVEAPEDFGTQLAAPKPEEDDGIEFTTTGFAEMEAAGQAEDQPPTASDAAIDFEFGSDAGQDQVEEPAPEPDLAAQTVRIDTSQLDLTGEGEPAGDAAPEDVEAVAAAAPEPEPEPPEDAGAEQVEADTTEGKAPSFTDEPSMADTSPIDPVSEGEDQEAVTGAVGLSDEDIEKIARRVVELASDRLDQIAWEVVPDMAEIVVRQRIRELEAESEAVAPDSVQ